MAPAFDMFVVFAEMRTGSNLLEAALNQLPGVACHGEVFNPHFIGYPDRDEILGVTLRRRTAEPERMLRRLREAPGLNGFRFFHDHDPRIPEAVLADRRCAKVILTRNPVESYVSLQIARATGQWKLGDGRHRKESRVRFDAAGFAGHLEAIQAFQLRLMRGLQVSGQTAFYIDYEDLQDLDVLNGLAAFLGVGAGLEALPRSLVKQNPESLREKVSNYATMEAALARLDRFNLSRTPGFEPRRGGAVPSFIAAPGARALFLPIKAGPVERVAGWLAALEGGEAGLQRDFTRKSLRAWLGQAGGHRAFTVLRHPVARAHAAFCAHILPGGYAEIREALRKLYKVPLPPVAEVPGMDLAAHRDAFLGFARFLKANLNGQTSLRIDAAWASQAAVIQGFSQVLQPDLIAREESLPEDLAHLAAALGRPMPPLPEPAPEAPFALAEVVDDEVEAALHEAYQRDHLAFGFGRWPG